MPLLRVSVRGCLDTATGRLVHPVCGRVAALDIGRLRTLADGDADEAWFLERYRARLLDDGSGDSPDDRPAAWACLARFLIDVLGRHLRQRSARHLRRGSLGGEPKWRNRQTRPT